MKFTELNLNKQLLKGILEAGFSDLMPVQAETLKFSLKTQDVYVQSQTGTGKTAAFLITIFQLFLDTKCSINKKALIVAPTRELAIQIEKEAKILGKYLNFKVGCFYGGVGYNTQERLLKNGVDIIVGTPGRLLDYYNKGKIDFNKLGFVVIDEADRMFDMGFLPDIRRIMKGLSKKLNRQIMLFSATLDPRTRTIAREYMKNPQKVEIEPEQITVEKISQVLYHVNEREKLNLMLGILKKEVPRNALIFTNMRHEAARVARHLEYNGYKCQHITGDLPQSKRLKIINHFKAGQLPFLVATDVAARGLHINDLELIINYDIPGECENYVHRIGRTARAGKSGKAISLVCDKYVYNLEAIESYLGKKIPIAMANDDLFIENKADGLTFKHPKGQRRELKKKKSHKPSRQSTNRPQKPKIKQQKKQKLNDKNTFEKKEPKKIHKKSKDRQHLDKKKTKRLPKTSTIEDRLEYYKKKYGENFNIQRATDQKPQKKTLFKKIKAIFKRKK